MELNAGPDTISCKHGSLKRSCYICELEASCAARDLPCRCQGTYESCDTHKMCDSNTAMVSIMRYEIAAKDERIRELEGNHGHDIASHCHEPGHFKSSVKHVCEMCDAALSNRHSIALYRAGQADIEIAALISRLAASEAKVALALRKLNGGGEFREWVESIRAALDAAKEAP